MSKGDQVYYGNTPQRHLGAIVQDLNTVVTKLTSMDNTLKIVSRNLLKVFSNTTPVEIEVPTLEDSKLLEEAVIRSWSTKTEEVDGVITETPLAIVETKDKKIRTVKAKHVKFKKGD